MDSVAFPEIVKTVSDFGILMLNMDRITDSMKSITESLNDIKESFTNIDRRLEKIEERVGTEDE